MCNLDGNSQFEGKIPAPVCFEEDIPQSEGVDCEGYTNIQLAKLPGRNKSPSITSSIQRLNDLMP